MNQSEKQQDVNSEPQVLQSLRGAKHNREMEMSIKYTVPGITWKILPTWIVLTCVWVASVCPALVSPAIAQANEPALRQLTDGPADRALLGALLQGHLRRLTEVIRKSPRVEVVAYGDAVEKARILPICKRLSNELQAGLVRQPVPVMRQSDSEEAYYQQVSAIAKEYAPAREEKLASIQDSPKAAANAREDFRRDLDSWFLDRNWTYRGMDFPILNSMGPDSKPRRYAHDLWLYANGQGTDGQLRYLQLEFFVYQEVGAKEARIDSISTFDLTPDRGFGPAGSRLGFNGSWFSKQAWGAVPLKYHYEAFGVAAAGEKVVTWNLFRKPEKRDIPKDWQHESWSFKTEIYSDLPANENDGPLTCSFLIK